MKASRISLFASAAVIAAALAAYVVVGLPSSSSAAGTSQTDFLDALSPQEVSTLLHGDGLVVSNIGSSGKDGVSVEYDEAHLGALTLRELASSPTPVFLGVASIRKAHGATIAGIEVHEAQNLGLWAWSPPASPALLILARDLQTGQLSIAPRPVPPDRLDHVVAPGASVERSHICIGVHIQNENDICIGIHIDS